MFIDTHCHIQEAAYPLPLDETLMRAREAGVERMICVGTNVTNSNEAVEFAAKHSGLFATIGVHPHDTKDGYRELARLAERPEVVAVGEIGLDYFYAHSSREVQIEALQWQIDLALRHDLPIVFHVREAFDDFWPIFDNFLGVRGELHSFTDNQANLEAGLQRGLLIGVNGISTFTKDPQQRAVFASLPLEKMLLETDAPFLTPQPFRGKVNEPAFVKVIAEHHAALRGISLKEIADMTTANAVALFAL